MALRFTLFIVFILLSGTHLDPEGCSYFRHFRAGLAAWQPWIFFIGRGSFRWIGTYCTRVSYGNTSNRPGIESTSRCLPLRGTAAYLRLLLPSPYHRSPRPQVQYQNSPYCLIHTMLLSGHLKGLAAFCSFTFPSDAPRQLCMIDWLVFVRQMRCRFYDCQIT